MKISARLSVSLLSVILSTGCASTRISDIPLDRSVPVVDYAGEWQGRSRWGKRVIVRVGVENGQPVITAYEEVASNAVPRSSLTGAAAVLSAIGGVEWNGFLSTSAEEIDWDDSSRTLAIRTGRRTVGAEEPRWHSSLSLQFLSATRASLQLDRWADPILLAKKR